jgi:methylglutaconyl-CoA hydratase
MDSRILIEGQSVKTVWLKRPEVHNAMDERMIAELTEAFQSLGNDKKLRAIVLRGKGKSFCAGADLNYMKSIARFGVEENRQDAKKLAALFQAIYRCPVPTIAVVHGSAFGGANGLLASCDIVIAGKHTRFAFSEVKLGIAPATIAPFVMRRIGETGARELMITGRRFTTDEAERWNLVNRGVDEELLDEVLGETLRHISSAGPEAVRETKLLIHKVAESSAMDRLMDYTAELIAGLRNSPEGQEGMASFLEKRKPNWMQEKDL